MIQNDSKILIQANQSWKLYSAEQIQKIEHDWSSKKPLSQLAQRAGISLFQLAQNIFHNDSQLVIICGRGNNASDGYYCAIEAHKNKIPYQLFQVPLEQSTPSKVVQEAQEEALSMGITVYNWSTDSILNQEFKHHICIDCILGIGITGAARGTAQKAIQWINQQPFDHVISADIPSGLDPNHGLGQDIVKSHSTLTFLGIKKGLFQNKAKDYWTHLYLEDCHVAIPKKYSLIQSISSQSLDACSQPYHTDIHKKQRGIVTICGGRHGMGGATYLASHAALLHGAGYVIAFAEESYRSGFLSSSPEIIFKSIKEYTVQMQSVSVIGPGLDRDRDAHDIIVKTLQEHPGVVLYDADALYQLPKSIQYKNPSQKIILTPHEQEAAALLNTTAQEVHNNRWESALKISYLYQSFCILKGPGTIISTPEGKLYCNILGSPLLATAGSGDTLAGTIASLIAQGISIIDACCSAVYNYSDIAQKWFQNKGSRGLTSQQMCLESVKQMNNYERHRRFNHTYVSTHK